MRAHIAFAIALSLGAMTPAVAQTADTAQGVTFAKDIAPILQAKCETCHRLDSMAPMSLVTYQEVRPWARAIKEKVQARLMPPWHLDKTVGIQAFKNDISLTDTQVQTIVSWVDTGAPLGSADDLPEPIQWPDQDVWRVADEYGFGEPDLVVRSVPWTQAAEG